MIDRGSDGATVAAGNDAVASSYGRQAMMNRREFVAGTAAVTIASQLPPVSALVSQFIPSKDEMPVNGMSLVQEAFNTVERLKFDFEETSRIFGHGWERVDSIAELRGLVFEDAFESGSDDVWTRIDAVTRIQLMLDERAGTNLHVHHYYLSLKPMSSLYSFHARMGRGRIQDLLYTARVLPYYLPLPIVA